MQKAIQAASKRSRQERIEVEPSFVPKAQRRAVEWSGALHWAGLSLSLESAQLCASLGVREPVAAAFKVQPFGDDWETQLAWFKTLEDMAETPLCLRGAITPRLRNGERRGKWSFSLDRSIPPTRTAIGQANFNASLWERCSRRPW